MKYLLKSWTFLIVVSVCLVMVPEGVFGQTVDTTGTGGIFDSLPNADELLNIYNAIYGALVILWGFIAQAFGLKDKVKSFVFVVVAGGLVLAGGFVAFGVMDFLPLAITLIGSLGLYDIFKGLKKAGTKKE